MNIKERIKNLLDIDISTDSFEELKADPERYVASPEDAEKLKDLFLLIELTEQTEDERDDIR